MPKAPVLRTARLLLRPFAPDDAEALYAACRHPELGDNAGWKPHASLAESQQVLAEVFLDRPTVWAVCDAASGRLVGSVGLLPDPKRENPDVRMLGYWLDRAWWGRGAMSEAARAAVDYAFSQLGVPLLTVCCYRSNERSRRLIERLGFLFEGELHAAVRDHRGMTLDLLSYYLPRPDASSSTFSNASRSPLP